jgi:late competence protein required for DNA uptake (superfamily II DNA/RNA helicase)
MAVPTYLELATMANDANFVSRCAVSIVNFAKYTIGNNGAGVKLANWARNVLVNGNARSVASQMALHFAVDSAFATQNPLNWQGTPDATFDSVVQTAINTMLTL